MDTNAALKTRLDATCREALGLVPRPNQWLAAQALVEGRLAELATGEGKTLALALAAALLALRGRSVHLLTANDYLATRAARQLHGWYARLGLRVAAVSAEHTTAERAAAYRADVVYVSARELVFDSLRDQVAGRSAWSASARDARLSAHARALTQTPDDDAAATVSAFDAALIDEADSILLDEAVMPLVLARHGEAGERLSQLGTALDLAARLQPGRDFELQPVARDAALTPAGAQRLDTLCTSLARLWRHRLHREELVRLALVATHLLQPQLIVGIDRLEPQDRAARDRQQQHAPDDPGSGQPPVRAGPRRPGAHAASRAGTARTEASAACASASGLCAPSRPAS